MESLDRFKVTLKYNTAVKTKKLKDNFKTSEEQEDFKNKLIITKEMLIWLKQNNWSLDEVEYLISSL
jgi:hypothetical protein